MLSHKKSVEINHIITYPNNWTDIYFNLQVHMLMILSHSYAPLLQNTFFTVMGFKMGAPSPELKWPQPDADHSLPSSAKVKNARSYTPPLHMSCCGATMSTGTILLFTFQVKNKSQSLGYNKPILSPEGRTVTWNEVPLALQSSTMWHDGKLYLSIWLLSFSYFVMKHNKLF